MLCLVYELSLGYFALCFTWIYCQRSSDSAVNDRCVDLLRALNVNVKVNDRFKV